MRMHALRHYPLVLLAVVAVAFVGWIWWDAKPRAPVDAVGRLDVSGPGKRVESMDATIEDPTAPPDPTPVRGISRLKPGMTRAEVEKLVGLPDADRVYPVTVADGRATYHAAYEADLGPAPTVRPIASRRIKSPPVTDPATRTLVTLEFDATKPGHPLVGIHYPDPLF